jgi:hypothetical protein
MLNTRYKTPKIKTTLLLPAHILTSLFDKIRFPNSPLIAFAAPPVEPQLIVDSLIEALEAQESRVIRLPFYTNIGRIMGAGPGLLPKFIGDVIQKVRKWSTVLGSKLTRRSLGPILPCGIMVQSPMQRSVFTPRRQVKLCRKAEKHGRCAMAEA